MGKIPLHSLRHLPPSLRVLSGCFRLLSTSTRETLTTVQKNSSLYIMKTMLDIPDIIERKRIEDTFDNMEIPLLMQNIAMTLVNCGDEKLLKKQELLKYVTKKLNSLAIGRIDYTLGNSLEPIVAESYSVELYDQLLDVTFQLSLNMGLTSVSESLMLGTINRFKRLSFIPSLLDLRNVELLVEMYTVIHSQSRNVKDINNIFIIVGKYNELMKLLRKKRFQFTDRQIKAIIDKAYSTLFEEQSTATVKPFPSTSNYAPPHSTIELLIRRFGEIISSRVSKSISYYQPNDFIKKDRENESSSGSPEDFDFQEIMDRQLLNKYLQFCYYVIHARCSHNDPTNVYIIWTIIKPFHNKIYNSIINSETNNLSNNFYYYQTISRMIRLFSKNKRYRGLINELIYDLPLDSVKVCPELMASILYHCGRSNNQSLASIVGSRYDDSTQVEQGDKKLRLNMQKLFGQGGDLNILGTGEKFTHGQVRAFLAYSLRIGDRKSALQIMDYCRFKMIQFTDIDFNELVRSVLYSENSFMKENKAENEIDLARRGETAWDMIEANVKSNDHPLNKYALITYLDFMINTSLISKTDLDLARVDDVYKLASTHVMRNDTKYWNHFNMSYLKYVIRKYPLKIAQSIYNNCKKFTNQRKQPVEDKCDTEGQLMYFQQLEEYGYQRNPFITPFMEVRFNMNEDLQVNILRDIYQQSTSYQTRAKNLASVDLEDAKREFKELSRWVYDELMEINHNVHHVNKRVTHKSIVIDLIRTINSRSNKIGFKLTPYGNAVTHKKMSDSEKEYRINLGEQIAIGGVSLEDDFQASSDGLYDTWNNAMGPRRRPKSVT